MRRVLDQFWFPPIARALQRLTIPGIFSHYALRKKCIANLARAALESGTGQLVVLGAGFDGCALQLAGEFPQAIYWEIDHPATQRWKAWVMADVAPPGPHLIPADLSADVLPTNALRGSFFDSQAASFWIAEGLLMYFPEPVVQSLIGAISDLTTAGSGFVFSFMEKRPDGRIRFREQSRLVNWWLRRRGEPFLWSATRDEVRELLRSWHNFAFFDHADLRALGHFDDHAPLAAGEILCLATR